MIELIAHTPPDANIPSKKTPKIGLTSKRLTQGDQIKLIRNPTQVDVHITQDINPDMNLQIPLNGINSFSPKVLIHNLCSLKIDP
jgi:hypothetical protein